MMAVIAAGAKAARLQQAQSPQLLGLFDCSCLSPGVCLFAGTFIVSNFIMAYRVS